MFYNCGGVPAEEEQRETKCPPRKLVMSSMDVIKKCQQMKSSSNLDCFVIVEKYQERRRKEKLNNL